jgi:hypothetical protein
MDETRNCFNNSLFIQQLKQFSVHVLIYRFAGEGMFEFGCNSNWDKWESEARKGLKNDYIYVLLSVLYTDR